MSYSPILGNPKPQYEDSLGVPYVGMRLFFYAAGTSTKQDTKTDSAGGTTNTNPVVIGADGYPESNVMIYGDDSLIYKVVAAPPGSDDPPTSPLWTSDNLSPASATNARLKSDLASTTDVAKGDALIGGKRTDSGTVAFTLHDFNETRYLDVMTDFGAVGDGVTDDYAAIRAATDAAAANGWPLYLPPKTYAVDVSGTDEFILFGCDVFAYGATIKITAADVNAQHGVSNYNGTTKYTGFSIHGLTVDAQSNSRGMYFSSAHNYTIRDCKINNAKQAGIATYSGNYVVIDNCHINGVIYSAGVGAADGIYSAGGDSVSIINNHIEDFRRIGIVSEQDGATNSINTNTINNVIHNANNCDDSATEFNAGIWYENTNGGVIRDNNITDITSNSGQTSGRVSGLVYALGVDAKSGVQITNNKIDGKLDLNSNDQFTSAVVSNNYIQNAGGAMSGFDTLELTNNHFDTVAFDSGGVGCYLFDLSSAARAINTIIIDGLTHSNITETNYDSAHINIFSGAASRIGSMHIKNVVGVSFVNRVGNTGIDKLFVSDSTISHGSTTGYGMLRAGETYVSNTKFTYRGNSTSQNNFMDAQGAIGKWQFTDCLLNGLIFNIAAAFDCDYIFNGCRFESTQIGVATTAAIVMKFDSCYIDEYHATNGFIKTNFSAVTGNELLVRNCDFRNSTDITPLQKWNNNPNMIILQGNSYDSTSLHSFGAPDSDINNISV